jgi:CheY-like chemotaxis protein
MVSQLCASGYTVEEAENGMEALQKYQVKSYDLILTDIEMPEMDGYELAAGIRRLEKAAGCKTTIIAITASDFDLEEGKAHEAGFDGFMLKPLDLKVLSKKLANISSRTTQADRH